MFVVKWMFFFDVFINHFPKIHGSALCKGRFSLDKLNANFAAKYIWAYALAFAHSLSCKIFLFKIVKINLTNSQWQKSPTIVRAIKIRILSSASKHIAIRSNQRPFQIIWEIYMYLQLFFQLYCHYSRTTYMIYNVKLFSSKF